MEKCEICGKYSDKLEQCDICGQLYCPDCGQLFICDECLDEELEKENHYHGCFF